MGDFLKYGDADLLGLYYKTRDQKWLGILLNRYSALLFGVCLKYLKETNSAQDAVQQVFLKTLSSVDKTNIRDMGAWLYQVARNECFSRLRVQCITEHVEDFSRNKDSENSLSIRDWMKEERKFEALEKAMLELKPDQRNCIDLFYLKEKSYKEISDQLGFSLKEVKSFIQNGKRNLKVRLTTVFEKIEKGEGNG